MIAKFLNIRNALLRVLRLLTTLSYSVLSCRTKWIDLLTHRHLLAWRHVLSLLHITQPLAQPPQSPLLSPRPLPPALQGQLQSTCQTSSESQPVRCESYQTSPSPHWQSERSCLRRRSFL